MPAAPRPPRVVVSGIGLITPLGADRESSWRGLVRGESAARWLTSGESMPSGTAAGALLRFAGAPFTSPRGPAASPEPAVDLALRAAAEAVADARLDLGDVAPRRIGCVIGTSKGGLRSFARACQQRREDETVSAGDWVSFLPNTPASVVAAALRVGGPVLCPIAACATGLVSLQRGVDLVRDGTCDVAVAGSTDASLTPAVLASFHRLGVLAKGFADPATACRPFDRDRSGFVVGEGAAVLVVERLEAARARGARPYAEWLGGGLVSDAAGLTGLDPDAAALTHLVRMTMDRSGVAPGELDYANLHGTATRSNDFCETRALRRVLGVDADGLSCSGLKGGIGHLLGAAGSVETAATLLALRDGVVPPTVNLVMPDPECDLDYTPGSPRRRPLRTALKLSLGFGGHLAAAVVRRIEEDPREPNYDLDGRRGSS